MFDFYENENGYIFLAVNYESIHNNAFKLGRVITELTSSEMNLAANFLRIGCLFAHSSVNGEIFLYGKHVEAIQLAINARGTSFQTTAEMNSAVTSTL